MKLTRYCVLVALAVVATVALALAGALDVDTGMTGVLLATVAGADFKALEASIKGWADKVNGDVKRCTDQVRELRDQVIEVAQRHGTKHGGGLPEVGGSAGELGGFLSRSENLKRFLNGETPSCTIQVPSRSVFRNAITRTAPGVQDPLVVPERGRIVMPPELRLTIRALFESVPVSTGTIEVPSESAFTDGSAIQGADASPTGAGEGTLKGESTATFALSAQNIPTIAHFITASRQVLQDAPMLGRYLESRLLYYLALKEETQFLTGSGSGLNMRGINTAAAAFAGGATNQTALDTLCKAIDQLVTAGYNPNGIVLHPTDWTNIRTQKDTTNNYLLGHPAEAAPAAIWQLPVVVTPSQTLGRFTVVAAPQLGYIADRETATVRVSENVGDQFVRNLVTILCEERALLVIEDANAACYGLLSHTG